MTDNKIDMIYDMVKETRAEVSKLSEHIHIRVHARIDKVENKIVAVFAIASVLLCLGNWIVPEIFKYTDKGEHSGNIAVINGKQYGANN